MSQSKLLPSFPNHLEGIVGLNVTRPNFIDSSVNLTCPKFAVGWFLIELAQYAFCKNQSACRIKRKSVMHDSIEIVIHDVFNELESTKVPI